MTFRGICINIIVVFVLCTGATWSSAGCLSRDIETTSKGFQAYYVCENSLVAPGYNISTYMGSQVSFGVFSFDKTGAAYLCHEFENSQQSEASCSSGGMRDIRSTYNTKKAKVHLLDFDETIGAGKATRAFGREARYSTVDSIEGAQIQGCFVRVVKQDVYYGYKGSQFNSLANCLIEFERALSKDKKMLFDLM